MFFKTFLKLFKLFCILFQLVVLKIFPQIQVLSFQLFFLWQLCLKYETTSEIRRQRQKKG